MCHSPRRALAAIFAKPVLGWRGIVDCEVLEVREPRLLRFSWTGEEGGTPTFVTYRIEPQDGGTRFTYEHVGFTGLGGFFMARLIGSVRKKMLTVGLPAVLDDLEDAGTLRVTSTLRANPRPDRRHLAGPRPGRPSRTVILTIRLRTPRAPFLCAPVRKNHHIPCVNEHTGSRGSCYCLEAVRNHDGAYA